MKDKKRLDPVMKDIIKIIYDKHSKEKWDSVLAVVGDEGISKSTFASNWLHEWLLLKNGEVKREDARHMCLDREMWTQDLKDSEKLECTVYDEADMYSRRSMDNFNVKVNRAYQIIRADNLCTLLVLPSLWDLDTFFRNRRLRFLVHVYERGKYHFWSKTRLRRMVELNARYPVKNYYVVKPTHRGWFSIYDGVIEEQYRINKDIKLQKAKKDLFDDLNPKKEVSERDKIIKNMVNQGLTQKRISELIGMSSKTVSRTLNKATDIDNRQQVYINGGQGEKNENKN